MPVKYRTVAIIYNSRAGDGQSYQWAVQLKELLDTKMDALVSIINVETSHYKNIYHAAYDLSTNNCDLLVAIGGDGTINQVAGGIVDSKKDTILGVLPAGSVNNFAHALKIPLSRPMAMENILSGEPKAVDIGKINDTYMMSSMTLGVLADIAEDVSYKEKQAYGPFAFMKNAARVIRKNKSYRLLIDYGQGEYFLKTKILLVSMTNSIGGFERLNPNAELNDGLFHVYSLDNLQLWKAILLLPKILKGEFSELEEVNYVKTPTLKIRSAKLNKAYGTRIDGDPVGTLPLEMEVIRGGIRVIVPYET